MQDLSLKYAQSLFEERDLIIESLSTNLICQKTTYALYSPECFCSIICYMPHKSQSRRSLVLQSFARVELLQEDEC